MLEASLCSSHPTADQNATPPSYKSAAVTAPSYSASWNTHKMPRELTFSSYSKITQSKQKAASPHRCKLFFLYSTDKVREGVHRCKRIRHRPRTALRCVSSPINPAVQAEDTWLQTKTRNERGNGCKIIRENLKRFNTNTLQTSVSEDRFRNCYRNCSLQPSSGQTQGKTQANKQTNTPQTATNPTRMCLPDYLQLRQTPPRAAGTVRGGGEGRGAAPQQLRARQRGRGRGRRLSELGCARWL